jgi:TonB family protein
MKNRIMIKSLLVLMLGLMLFQTAKAQQDTLLYYMKNSGVATANKDSADYFMLIMPPDTSTGKKLYPVREYYADRKIKLLGTSITNDFKALKFDGICMSYFPNGKRSEIITYRAGEYHGSFTDYYPNGQLYDSGINNGKGNLQLIDCRDSIGKKLAENGNGKWVMYDNMFKNILIEGNVVDSLKEGEWHGLIGKKIICVDKYSKGNFISGIYYDVKGKEHPFKVLDIEPHYEEGIPGFYRFLGQNIKYPDIDKQNNVQGKVIVSFVVERDGALTDIKVLRSPTERMGAEAARVISLCPNWMPGIQNGMPVRVQYTVPLSFTLNNK